MNRQMFGRRFYFEQKISVLKKTSSGQIWTPDHWRPRCIRYLQAKSAVDDITQLLYNCLSQR